MFDGSEIASIATVDFGLPALLTTPGDPDITINVILDEKPVDIMGVQSDKPQITVDAVYRERIVNKDSVLTFDGIDYRLTRPNTEMGMTTAYLVRI